LFVDAEFESLVGTSYREFNCYANLRSNRKDSAKCVFWEKSRDRGRTRTYQTRTEIFHYGPGLRIELRALKARIEIVRNFGFAFTSIRAKCWFSCN